MKSFSVFPRALLLAVLCFIAAPAPALTLIKSTGEVICEIDRLTLAPDGERKRGEVIVTCVAAPKPPPPVDTTPVPPAPGCRDIPFARYLADGHTGRDGLMWIILHSGWGSLKPCEFEAAYAAGYPREPSGGGGGGGGGASYDPYSAILDWDAAANGNGYLYYLRGSGGSKFFTVPVGYVGDIVLEAVANTNSHHNSITATIDGKDAVTVGGWGGPTHKVRLAPGQHEYTVTLDQPGGVTIVLRHYP